MNVFSILKVGLTAADAVIGAVGEFVPAGKVKDILGDVESGIKMLLGLLPEAEAEEAAKLQKAANCDVPA